MLFGGEVSIMKLIVHSRPSGLAPCVGLKRKIVKNKIYISTLLLLGFIMLSVAYLEYGSNHNSCTYSSGEYVYVYNSNYYPFNQQNYERINELIRMKRLGIEPSREELLNSVIIVPYEDMKGVNGTYYHKNIYIRDNLSENAKAFVARHELDHVFQENIIDYYCDNNEEYCATMNAAKYYPIGLLETITSSLITAYDNYPDKQCFFFGSWKIFRYYIFP
jgi:hypothetical protein